MEEEEEDDQDRRANQSLIPGLPEDLALKCLSKISHGFHGVLECVSKSWGDAIRSIDYACLKASEGWCGNWLFVSLGEDLWDAYDPDADKWHTLPRMPKANNDGRRCGFSCVCACKKLLVIGGHYVLSSDENEERLATNEVMMFDPFKKQWTRVTSMPTERTDFACAVICDMVYVAGGGNSCGTGGLAAAEVYDARTDRWKNLATMPFPLIECFSISRGGQFHVVGKKEFEAELDTHVIYDPVEQRWHVVEDLSLFSNSSRFTTTVMNQHIYTIWEDDGSVRTIDTDQTDWITLGVLPAVVLPYHNRPLKPFAYGFIAFQRYLYVVGGLTLRYDSNTNAYGIVKLDSCRICDPAKSPLEWHDVRPMTRPLGGLIYCTTMEE